MSDDVVRITIERIREDGTREVSHIFSVDELRAAPFAKTLVTQCITELFRELGIDDPSPAVPPGGIDRRDPMSFLGQFARNYGHRR